jgi:hypothetical protein
MPDIPRTGAAYLPQRGTAAPTRREMLGYLMQWPSSAAYARATFFPEELSWDGTIMWNLGSRALPQPSDAEILRLLFEGAEGPRPSRGWADVSGHLLDETDPGARQRLQMCAHIWRRIRDDQIITYGTRPPSTLLAAIRPHLARIVIGCMEDGTPGNIVRFGPDPLVAPHVQLPPRYFGPPAENDPRRAFFDVAGAASAPSPLRPAPQPLAAAEPKAGGRGRPRPQPRPRRLERPPPPRPPHSPDFVRSGVARTRRLGAPRAAGPRWCGGRAWGGRTPTPLLHAYEQFTTLAPQGRNRLAAWSPLFSPYHPQGKSAPTYAPGRGRYGARACWTQPPNRKPRPS